MGWPLSKNDGRARPQLSMAKVTDPAGNVLFISKGDADQSSLESGELAQIPQMRRDTAELLHTSGQTDGNAPSQSTPASDLRGFVWVASDKQPVQRATRLPLSRHGHLRRDLDARLGAAGAAHGALHLAAAGAAARGTAALMTRPKSGGHFPVAGGRSQRDRRPDRNIQPHGRLAGRATRGTERHAFPARLHAGQCAHRPGILRPQCRFVRVNQVFADLTGVAVSRHLGPYVARPAAAPVAGEMRNRGAARLCERGTGAQPGTDRRGRQSPAGRGPG